MTLQKKNKVKGNNVEKAAGLGGHEMSESLKFNRENYKYFQRYCGKIATRNKTQERIQKKFFFRVLIRPQKTSNTF